MSFNRRDFKDQLALLAQALQLQIETDVEGFANDPAASSARRKEAGDSFRFFVKTYFPHFATVAPSVMHEFVFDFLPASINQAEGLRAAIAAPRGEAKSTIITQLFSLWCALTARKHFILIIMDTYEQAAEMLEEMKAELEFNVRLQMDFPEATGRGRVWRDGVAVTINGVKLKAFGSGKKLRGQRHGPHRPDLVVCDDLENDENVNSPTQRDKLEKWFKKTVLNVGSANGRMDAIVVGTILHYDSVLARLLRNKLWESKAFRAILTWPDHMDLWDQWEALLFNEGKAMARAFFESRISAMTTGASVSWPALRDLYSLMLKRATDGHDAFDSEQQNDPSAGDAAPLASSIKTFAGITAAPSWVWFGAVDPSLGKAGASRDPSAILAGAFDRVTRRLYVFKASIKKRLPSVIITDVISVQRECRCLLWGVESVQFQEFLRTEIIRQSLEAGVPVPARAIIPHADKLLRIESLQPFMAAGNILIHTSCCTLIEQLKHFPLGDHDDGPDALHMLWMLASTSVRSAEFYGANDLARLEGGTGLRHEADDTDRSDY